MVEGLKYPTPDYLLTDRDPEIYWDILMRKLPHYVEQWARDGYDDYIKQCMVEKGPLCLGWAAFGAVLCDVYKTAVQRSQISNCGVIQAAYTLLRENKCTKMCNVMELVLLELQ